MTIVYRNETSYCGPISMLRKLDTGDLVVVFREALWTGGKPHQDPTTRTSFIRSTDDGETWHTLITPDPAGGNCTTAQGERVEVKLDSRECDCPDMGCGFVDPLKTNC